MTPLTTVDAIDHRTVTTRHVMTQQEGRIADVDLVVLAYGGEALDTLSDTATQQVSEVHLIGDAMAPRRLMDAILDGARTGRLV